MLYVSWWSSLEIWAYFSSLRVIGSRKSLNQVLVSSKSSFLLIFLQCNLLLLLQDLLFESVDEPSIWLPGCLILVWQKVGAVLESTRPSWADCWSLLRCLKLFSELADSELHAHDLCLALYVKQAWQGVSILFLWLHWLQFLDSTAIAVWISNLLHLEWLLIENVVNVGVHLINFWAMGILLVEKW